jgi:hypothetical protein
VWCEHDRGGSVLAGQLGNSHRRVKCDIRDVARCRLLGGWSDDDGQLKQLEMKLSEGMWLVTSSSDRAVDYRFE